MPLKKRISSSTLLTLLILLLFNSAAAKPSNQPLSYPVQPGEWVLPLPKNTDYISFSTLQKDGWKLSDWVRTKDGLILLNLTVPQKGRLCGLIWLTEQPDQARIFCFFSDPKGYPDDVSYH